MSKQRQPVLEKDLPALTPQPSALDGVDIEKVLVDGCALARQQAGRVRFDGVRVVTTELCETRVTALSWIDVECARSDLSLIDWPAAKLTRVAFRDCRTTGARLAGAVLDDVRFVGCQLEYAVFSGARFRRVSFEQCRLRDADFGNADLAGTSFVDCDLRGVDFVGAKLSGADVRTSTLQEVRVEARDLRGLIVSREQAAALAQLFGLVVRDS